jgi:hypothetical protein
VGEEGVAAKVRAFAVNIGGSVLKGSFELHLQDLEADQAARRARLRLVAGGPC